MLAEELNKATYMAENYFDIIHLLLLACGGVGLNFVVPSK